MVLESAPELGLWLALVRALVRALVLESVLVLELVSEWEGEEGEIPLKGLLVGIPVPAPSSPGPEKTPEFSGGEKRM